MTLRLSHTLPQKYFQYPIIDTCNNTNAVPLKIALLRADSLTTLPSLSKNVSHTSLPSALVRSLIWTGLSLLDNVQSVQTAASFSNWPLTCKVCFSCLPSDVSHIPEVSRCFLHYAAVSVGNKKPNIGIIGNKNTSFSSDLYSAFSGPTSTEQNIAINKANINVKKHIGGTR